MCFSSKTPTPVTPAPAPAAPEAPAQATEVGAARKASDKAAYGSDTPNLRVDRSATSGGVISGGTGLRM